MPDGSFVEPMHTTPTPPAPPDVHLVFQASEMAVRRALASLRASLKALLLDESSLGTVEIILAEVLNNIVEHAYSDSEPGTITVSCNKATGGLRFEVRDQGRMLPGGEVPAKPSHDLDAGLDQLPEGGFGWGLIREMTTMLLYKRSEEQNILRFGVILENV